MNQRGPSGRFHLAHLDKAPDDRRTVTFPKHAAAGLERGARLLFYELRGEGDDARGYVTGWGEIERLSLAEGTVAIQLREFIALKRRVPFAELRADPRRDRAAAVQPVSADLFNTVLSKSRR